MKIPTSAFIYINLAIILIFIVFIVIGYTKGFLFALLSLTYSVVSAFIAWFLAPVLAKLYPFIKLENLSNETQMISKFVSLDSIVNTVVYFIIIFLVLKVFFWILSFVLQFINKLPIIGKFNQMLGAVVGALNALIITIGLSILLSLPVIKNGTEVRNGTLFRLVGNVSEAITNYLVDNIDFVGLRREYENFDVDTAREEFRKWLEINSKNE